MNRSVDDGLGSLGAIDRALLEYFEESVPLVAVMLEGAWGAGKSHFLRHRGERLAARAGKKYLSLSVAGLSTRLDLEQALFFAATPLLDNAYASAAGVFTRAAMRWAKIDPNELKPTANLTPGQVVVVLDDVERFAGNFKVILGFVIDLVDTNGIHVVVVASEAKLLKLSKKIGEWKEKAIGRTVRLLPEPQVMIDESICALPNRRVADELMKHRDSLVAVLVQSEMSSFRAVKHCLREISSVCLALGDKFFSLQAAQLVLIEGLFIGLLEIKRNAAKTNEVAKLFSHSDLGLALQSFVLRKPDSASDGSDELAEEVLRRYDGTSLIMFPGGRAFSQYFSLGITDVGGMVEALEELSLQSDAGTPSILGSRTSDFSQEEFDAQVAELEQQVRRCEIRSVSLLAKIYVSMRYWSEQRLVELTPDQITEICIAAIRAMPPDEVSDKEADTDFLWFQRELDQHDEAVVAAVKAKVADAFNDEVEHRRHQLRLNISTSEQSLGDLEKDWALTPLFVGDADQWVSALQQASANQLNELHSLIRRRLRIGGIVEYLGAERDSIRVVSQRLMDSLPETGLLSIAQVELRGLAQALQALGTRLAAAQTDPVE